ncbi:MAG: hypothetical protein Q8L39_04240 [Burkholderiales bacterium]|nr:hypothetical protein [Burkholderiales bacterium]
MENQPMKRVTLKTISDISRELSKVYREARNGRLDTADLGRYANALAILSRITLDADLETRVAALEDAKP